jgi:hypothetical protein
MAVPCPELGARPVIHVAGVVASQPHSWGAVTGTDAVPPEATTGPSAPTVTWHFADVGPLVTLEDEDEQAATPPAMNGRRTNSVHRKRLSNLLSLSMPYRACASSMSHGPADFLLSLKFHWLGPGCGERFPTVGMNVLLPTQAASARLPVTPMVQEKKKRSCPSNWRNALSSDR